MSEPSRDPLVAVQIQNVSHHYGDRLALDGVSFEVRMGEVFGLLGPNGSGKSTLFKLLSTLAPIQTGDAYIFGDDVKTKAERIRSRIGVVFQHPALDKQLTVLENVRYHGRLFGMGGRAITAKATELLERFRLADRADELVLKLSGGMRRKVELVKALLPGPRLLILDEPSTGLDVNARIDLQQTLKELRQRGDLTVILTTHLMDEADRCDRLAVLDSGKLLTIATPNALKDEIGGDVITFSGSDLNSLETAVRDRLKLNPTRHRDRLRIERPQAHLFVPELISALPGMIDSVSIGRPTLDDVFVRLTGRQLHENTDGATEPPSHRPRRSR